MDATGVNAQLRELIALWADPNSASLLRIAGLCVQLAETAASGKVVGSPDQELLRRGLALAMSAEHRMAMCVAIQTRTGTYSAGGTFGLLPCVATSDWEG